MTTSTVTSHHGDLSLRATHRWADDVTAEQRAEDEARSTKLIEGLLADGAETVDLRFTKGRFGRIATTKVTGPPRWRFPKARCSLSRTTSGRRSLAAGAGWRFTVYEVVWVIGGDR
jgi:hypothetical protein